MVFTAFTQLPPVHVPVVTPVTVGPDSVWVPTVNTVALAATLNAPLVPVAVMSRVNAGVWSVPSSVTVTLGAVPSVRPSPAEASPARTSATATASEAAIS